jgi:hypothetical protein
MLTPWGAPASGDLIEWYTNASIVEIGHDAAWARTLLAPHATVTVHDRASVDGCLATRSLSLGHDSSVSSSGQLVLVVAQDATSDGCNSNADCAGGTCQAGVCVADGNGACTEAAPSSQPPIAAGGAHPKRRPSTRERCQKSVARRRDSRA